jgi:Icc-related predicted phosphoesterase
MKVIVISDTHGLHHELDIPEGDLLLHAGDISLRGKWEEVKDFLDWFSAQPHPHKVFIAGNHDFYFESQSAEKIKEIIPQNIHYLNEELLEIDGIRIWGSPFTPIPNSRWAFNKERGSDIQPHWDLIPQHLDILMVHGPAKGILDKTLKEEHVGCQNLLETVQVKQPKMFIFGHIHEDRGQEIKHGIHFVNASSVDRHRTKVFPPFVFELDKREEFFISSLT